jgi:hypothetical protein
LVITDLKKVFKTRGEATLSELVAETGFDVETVTVALDYWRRRGNVAVSSLKAIQTEELGVRAENEGLPEACETRPCSGCVLSPVCQGSQETEGAGITVYRWSSKPSRQKTSNGI